MIRFLHRLQQNRVAEAIFGALAFTLWIAGLWGWTVLIYAVRTP